MALSEAPAPGSNGGTNRQEASAATLLAITLTLAACGYGDPQTSSGGSAAPSSDHSMSSSGHSMSPSDTAMKPGAYLTKGDYDRTMEQRRGTKVVLFFHARGARLPGHRRQPVQDRSAG